MWFRQGRIVGRSRTYRVKRADRGHRLTCFVAGRGAGGLSVAPKASVSA